MANEIVYVSSLAPFIEGLTKEKRSCGFKYHRQAYLLKDFDDYWLDNDYKETVLTPENLEGWLQQKENEGTGYLRNRIGVVIELAKYLNGLGYKSYIPKVEARYEVPIRHILTKQELKELFYQIDSYKPDTSNKDFVRMAEEYPILFRVLYHLGMRIKETCSLSMSQVDLEKGVFTISDGKGNKDRLVYLSDDMTSLCKVYVEYLTRILGESPKWFFPGKKSETHISVPAVRATFNALWKKTSFANTCNKKPTVHDLRHTYTTERINKWAEQGISFKEMLPYLSKQLGHKSYQETNYYYHIVEDAYNVIHEKDKTSSEVIPEVKRR